MGDGIGKKVLTALVTAACCYLVLPTLAVVPVSFTETDYITFPPQGFSFRWYREFLTEGPWRNSAITSLFVASISTVIATAAGTLAALGLRGLSYRWSRIIIWFFLLPIIIPSIVLAVALYSSFSKMGIVGTLFGLVVAHSILTIPFVIINVSAVMQQVDWRIVDAARSLGANPRTAFVKVTLPAIAPGVVAGAIFAFLTSFDEVVVALFVSGIDAVTLPVQMWNGIRFEVSPAVAAASSVLLLLSLVVLVLYGTIKRKAA